MLAAWPGPRNAIGPEAGKGAFRPNSGRAGLFDGDECPEESFWRDTDTLAV
jgi:hypothetical protein